jgi:putative ABC transport system ATP-binding protein
VASVECRNLHRFFRVGDNEVFALRDVSISLEPGELVALVGTSGSGKSTLLSCLAGLDEPDGGFVVIAGSRMSHRPEAERARLRTRHIGMLMQSGNLLDHLTIYENIRLQEYLADRRATADIRALLEALGIAGQANKLPRSLSGGEVARAALAVALAGDGAILLCDEPTAELDAASEAAILGELRRRCEQGSTTLVATHSDAVAAIADRTIHLKDGRVVHG